MAKIVLAGGTGNLGSMLIPMFRAREDEIIVLTRRKMIKHYPQVQFVQWDGHHMDDWVEEIEGADVLINLCGASINTRFTEDNKQVLRDSRIVPTRTLGCAVQQLARPPRLWINFSGVSIFSGAQQLQNELGDDFSDDFLGELAKHWEDAFQAVELQTTQKLVLRMGPVLSKQSGMFKELYPLAKWGLGGQVGDGQQMISWIHEDDFIRLVEWAVVTEGIPGILHACSPNPVPNREFMRALRHAVNSPIGLPLPTPMAKIGAFLKGVDPSLLLDSVPVTTFSTLEKGFEFNFPYIQPAFNQLVKKTT